MRACARVRARSGEIPLWIWLCEPPCARCPPTPTHPTHPPTPPPPPRAPRARSAQGGGRRRKEEGRGRGSREQGAGRRRVDRAARGGRQARDCRHATRDGGCSRATLRADARMAQRGGPPGLLPAPRYTQLRMNYADARMAQRGEGAWSKLPLLLASPRLLQDIHTTDLRMDYLYIYIYSLFELYR